MTASDLRQVLRDVLDGEVLLDQRSTPVQTGSRSRRRRIARCRRRVGLGGFPDLVTSPPRTTGLVELSTGAPARSRPGRSGENPLPSAVRAWHVIAFGSLSTVRLRRWQRQRPGISPAHSRGAGRAHARRSMMANGSCTSPGRDVSGARRDARSGGTGCGSAASHGPCARPGWRRSPGRGRRRSARFSAHHERVDLCLGHRREVLGEVVLCSGELPGRIDVDQSGHACSIALRSMASWLAPWATNARRRAPIACAPSALRAGHPTAARNCCPDVHVGGSVRGGTPDVSVRGLGRVGLVAALGGDVVGEVLASCHTPQMKVDPRRDSQGSPRK